MIIVNGNSLDFLRKAVVDCGEIRRGKRAGLGHEVWAGTYETRHKNCCQNCSSHSNPRDCRFACARIEKSYFATAARHLTETRCIRSRASSRRFLALTNEKRRKFLPCAPNAVPAMAATPASSK